METMYWEIICGLFIIVIIILSFFSLRKGKTKNLDSLQFNKFENLLFDQNCGAYFELVKHNKNYKTWDELSKIKKAKHSERQSGIYALYFPVDKIEETIPVYIGQSKDIYKRFKLHQNELLKVLSKPEKINKDKLLYRKILKFMSYRQLTINDLNFVILTECNNNKFNKLQKKYIKAYNSAEVGFNTTYYGNK